MERQTTGGAAGDAVHPAVQGFVGLVLAGDIPASAVRYERARRYIYTWGDDHERGTALRIHDAVVLERADPDGDRRAQHLQEAVMVALATEVMERYWREEVG